MQIYIPDLKKAEGQFVEYHGETTIIDPGTKVPPGDAPVLKIYLKAAYVQNRVLIKGNWRAGLEGECSRCLEKTAYTLEETFDEEFIHRQSGESGQRFSARDHEEQYFFKGEVLDLDEYFRHSFYISQPLKLLCRDECRGLCPVCGQNRNKFSCRCAEEEIDSRWSILEKLRN